MITKTSAYFVLLISLLIAGIAAWFSISGLAELFAAELIAVVAMASVLEIGKIVTTFALHHSWREIPNYIKFPAVGMVLLLMLITSLGIFGKLSRGFIEQEAPIVMVESQIASVDQELGTYAGRLQVQEELIKSKQRDIERYNRASDAYMYSGSIRRSLTVVDQNKQQIDQATAAIKTAQAEIQSIRDQMSPIEQKKIQLKQQISGIEAKLGPVKYVAELFGIDSHDKDGSGKAVRIVIVILMAAFDPLAIVLVCLFDWMLGQAKIEEDRRRKEKQANDELQMKEEERRAEKERQHALKMQQITQKSDDKEHKKRVRELEQELTSVRSEIAQNQKLKEIAEELKMQLASSEQDFAALLARATTDKKELDALRAEFTKPCSEIDPEEYHSVRNQLDTATEQLRSESFAHTGIIQQLQSEYDLTLNELDKTKGQVEAMSNKIQSLESENQKLAQQLKSASSGSEIQNQLIELDQLKDELNRREQALEQKMLEIQDKTDATEFEWKSIDLVSKHEYAPSADIRELVQKAARRQHIDAQVRLLGTSTDEQIVEILEDDPNLLTDPEVQARLTDDLAERLQALVRTRIKPEIS